MVIELKAKNSQNRDNEKFRKIIKTIDYLGRLGGFVFIIVSIEGIITGFVIGADLHIKNFPYPPVLHGKGNEPVELSFYLENSRFTTETAYINKDNIYLMYDDTSMSYVDKTGKPLWELKKFPKAIPPGEHGEIIISLKRPQNYAQPIKLKIKILYESGSVVQPVKSISKTFIVD